MSAFSAGADSLPSPSSIWNVSSDSIPQDYVEHDPTQRRDAKTAHMLGILGIAGTGLFYYFKRTDTGPFFRDQLREAFNFQASVFAACVMLSIVGSVVAAVLGRAAMVFSLATVALFAFDVALCVINSRKAAEGRVARYPFRLNILK